MLNVQLLKQLDGLQQISQLGHEKAVINPHVATEELQHAYYIYIFLTVKPAE